MSSRKPTSPHSTSPIWHPYALSAPFDDPHFERRPYDPLIAYAQSKTADVLLAVGISRRWAGDGIHANSCAPGSIHTNLSRHLDTATLQVLGAMDVDGNVITPDYYKRLSREPPPACCSPPRRSSKA
jgi:NAD(P)-dependent dehydrogenase (short-subunit alcohol dehydrogenase family)